MNTIPGQTPGGKANGISGTLKQIKQAFTAYQVAKATFLTSLSEFVSRLDPENLMLEELAKQDVIGILCCPLVSDVVPGSQASALQSLSSLSAAAPVLSQSIVSSGILDSIIGLSLNHSSATVQAAADSVVESVAGASPNFAGRLLESGVVSGLCTQLTAPGQKMVKEAAVSAISALMSSHVTHAELICHQSPVLSILTDVLSVPPQPDRRGGNGGGGGGGGGGEEDQSYALVQGVVRTLASTARYSAELAEFVVAGGSLPYIAGLVRGSQSVNTPPLLKATALSCLSHIARHNASLAEAVLQTGVANGAIACLTDVLVPKVRRAAVALLLQLAQKTPALAVAIVRDGAPAAVTRHLQLESSNPSDQLTGLTLVGTLASYTLESSKAMIDSGAANEMLVALKRAAGALTSAVNGSNLDSRNSLTNGGGGKMHKAGNFTGSGIGNSNTAIVTTTITASNTLNRRGKGDPSYYNDSAAGAAVNGYGQGFSKPGSGQHHGYHHRATDAPMSVSCALTIASACLWSLEQMAAYGEATAAPLVALGALQTCIELYGCAAAVQTRDVGGLGGETSLKASNMDSSFAHCNGAMMKAGSPSVPLPPVSGQFVGSGGGGGGGSNLYNGDNLSNSSNRVLPNSNARGGGSGGTSMNSFKGSSLAQGSGFDNGTLYQNNNSTNTIGGHEVNLGSSTTFPLTKPATPPPIPPTEEHRASFQDVQIQAKAAAKVLCLGSFQAASLEPFVDLSTPSPLMKQILKKLSVLLEGDPRSRQAFVTSGSLMRLQQCAASGMLNEKASHYVTLINNLFPVDVVNYYKMAV